MPNYRGNDRDVLMIAAQGNLIGGDVFALDGCRISSNAAREHSGTRRELKKKMAKLEARLDQMLRTHQNTDDAGDPDDDDRRSGGSGSAGVDRYRAQIDRIKGFLDTHPPRTGTSGREVKANITDNESAKLKSGSGYLQGYNALAMVDAKHQIVLHAEAVGQIHEAPLLSRMTLDTSNCRMEMKNSPSMRANAPGPEFSQRSTRWIRSCV